ncbi:MAG: hypothetical protein CK548_04560 [Opitutia bacterium]|nr:rhomboid family intramembrane serine protease [Opitutaceae bacterium]PHX72278.1 MAG: hypothetical protein CK548_04560 [Opitutae bacterium]
MIPVGLGIGLAGADRNAISLTLARRLRERCVGAVDEAMIPLADTAKQKRTPVVTMVLVAANLCAFGWELWLGFDGGPKVQASVIETHALVAKRAIAQWDSVHPWQTLVTQIFLYGGWAYLLGNLWFLWIFGGNVEDRLGVFKFLLFYLLAGWVAAGAAAGIWA